MKGHHWRKHLAACMALAIVACSTPLQAAAEQADGVELTAIALEEPTTESEPAESTVPVEKEMQETEAPSEEEMQETEASSEEDTASVEEAPTEAETSAEEAPAEHDAEAAPDESAPVGESVQVEGKSLLAAAGSLHYEVTEKKVEYVKRSWDDASKQVVAETVNDTLRYTNLSYLNGLQQDHITLYGSEYFKDGIETNWYYASDSITISSRMEVKGTVNLVLRDGVTITCNDGISVGAGATLNIYAQQDSSGTLKALADTNYLAAIGGEEGSEKDDKGDCGTIRVYGGHVVADCYSWGADAAGIGGGYYGDGGLFEMYGGIVEASGGSWSHYGGAGIGGGYGGDGGKVNIYGGKLTANGGASGAGIGGGDNGAGGEITIKGGTVTASGLGGTSGGGAGIGGGNEGSGGKIFIYDGDVTATGGSTSHLGGAGIGGGDSKDGGEIHIYGGNVSAEAGACSAGIGGGEGGATGKITIEGGTVFAKGKSGLHYGGAGIGGGSYGGDGTVTITGGDVTAEGNMYAAGIGGGHKGNGSTVKISGGKITATGGKYGAGIGGGYDRPSVYVEITDGEVNATGGAWGAGIGGSCYGAGGTIILSGGTVNVKSGGCDASAIGAGSSCENNSGVVYFKGASVTMDTGQTQKIGRYSSSKEKNANPKPVDSSMIIFEDSVEKGCNHVIYNDGNTTASPNQREEICKKIVNGMIYVKPVPGNYRVQWKWSEDMSTATATFKCAECGGNSVTKTVASTVTNLDDMQLRYRAEVEFNGNTYTKEQIVTVQNVSYQTSDYDFAEGKTTSQSVTTDNYTLLTEDMLTWNNGTYFLNKDVTIDDMVTVCGNVHLVLRDGATLTANDGIFVESYGQLHIHSQSEGTGKLIVKPIQNPSPVWPLDAVFGMVRIHGGIIEATGREITDVTHVIPTIDNSGKSCYKGGSAFSGNIKIYGGTIKAVGGKAGDNQPDSYFPQKDGAGFKGDVTIYGGTFEKTDCEMLDSSAKAAIYGGTFASEPDSKYLAAGYAVTNTDGKYVVAYDPNAAVKPSDRGDSGDDGEDYTAVITRKASDELPAFEVDAVPVSLSDIFDVTLTDADDEPLEPVWEAKETKGIQIDENHDLSFTAPGTYHVRIRDVDEIVYSEWQEIVVQSESVTPEETHLIADETLIEWVKVDYEKKYGTAVYPEITTKYDTAYDISVKNKDGEVLDIYVVDPKTGVGVSRTNAKINLPQTGIDARGTAAAVGGALALTAAGFWLLRRSSRRKNEDQ